jgi:hypothetical protein
MRTSPAKDTGDQRLPAWGQHLVTHHRWAESDPIGTTLAYKENRLAWNRGDLQRESQTPGAGTAKRADRQEAQPNVNETAYQKRS